MSETSDQKVLGKNPSANAPPAFANVPSDSTTASTNNPPAPVNVQAALASAPPFAPDLAPVLANNAPTSGNVQHTLAGAPAVAPDMTPTSTDNPTAPGNVQPALVGVSAVAPGATPASVDNPPASGNVQAALVSVPIVGPRVAPAPTDIQPALGDARAVSGSAPPVSPVPSILPNVVSPMSTGVPPTLLSISPASANDIAVWASIRASIGVFDQLVMTLLTQGTVLVFVALGVIFGAGVNLSANVSIMLGFGVLFGVVMLHLGVSRYTMSISVSANAAKELEDLLWPDKNAPNRISHRLAGHSLAASRRLGRFYYRLWSYSLLALVAVTLVFLAIDATSRERTGVKQASAVTAWKTSFCNRTWRGHPVA